MAPPLLFPGLSGFVEDLGVYFERYDLPRIAGRILGLLVVTPEPLSLDDMAAELGVSKASVSTDVRLVVGFGMAERVALPGDRRDYYRLAAAAWEQRLRVSIEGARALRDIASRGLAATPGETVPARERLVELRAFCDFSISEMGRMLLLWRRRRERAAADAAGAGGRRPTDAARRG